ncbi:MAG: Crp/Fnr family transcriptional regulator [Actinobacteria bacterium]|nr:Crp/Fnr family transcriptional regulator [Actinomycetota bacterium]
MEAVLGEYLPFWNQLSPAQRQTMQAQVVKRSVKAGTIVHNGSADCVGLILVISGRLRAYILSDEGKEITLYRLIERDMCLFSAACIMSSIEFEIIVEAEEDTEFFNIPAAIYKKFMQESAAVSNYTNELMAARFSDVMWLMDQVLHKKLDSRLAAFLLEESELEGTTELKITHEKIAQHLGNAREVITRMLKYFSEEGLISLSRGEISLADPKRLADRASGSIR